MAITIDNPEIEAIIQRRLQNGGFANVDQVLLEALTEDTLWNNPSLEERAWLNEKLERSMAQLERGEGLSLNELRQARCRPRSLAGPNIRVDDPDRSRP